MTRAAEEFDVNREWRISLAASLLPSIAQQGGRTPREAARAAFSFADAFIRDSDKREEVGGIVSEATLDGMLARGERVETVETDCGDTTHAAAYIHRPHHRFVSEAAITRCGQALGKTDGWIAGWTTPEGVTCPACQEAMKEKTG